MNARPCQRILYNVSHRIAGGLAEEMVPENEIDRYRRIEAHVADSMEFLRNLETCEWCRHPKRRVLRRIRLCRHCNRLRLRLKSLEAEAAGFQMQNRRPAAHLEYPLAVQRKMIECAQAEGRMYGRLYDDDFGPLGFEHEWRMVSQHYVRKHDMFYGIANDLDWSFTLNQKRYVFYLLSLMNREWMRQHRRDIAQNILFDEEQERNRQRRN